MVNISCHNSTKYAEQSGLPLEATFPEIINKISSDNRLTVREIVSVMGISSKRVHNILQQNINKKELCSKWVY